MLSLRPFRDKTAGTTFRAVNILLSGISTYAYPYSPNGAALFRGSMESLRNQLSEEACRDDARLISLCAAASSTLEEYTGETDRFIALRYREMQASIRLLADSVVSLHRGKPESALAVRQTAKELLDLSDMDDVAAINDRLKQCLNVVHRETEQYQTLRDQIEQDLINANRPDAPGATDAITGLPDVNAAIREITSVLQSGKNAQIVAFAIDHIESINQRFGFQTGDDVLLMLSQHLAQGLEASQSLFRWRGPCFIAFFDEGTAGCVASAKAARMIGTKLEYNCNRGTRAMMMPLACSTVLVSLGPGSSLANTIGKLDEFVTSRQHSSGAEAEAAHKY